MNIGILVINEGEAVSNCNACDGIDTFILSEHGYFVTNVINICNKEKVFSAFEYLKIDNEALLILGNPTIFLESLAEKYVLNSALACMEIDGIACAVAHQYSENFINDIFIPMLNGKCQTLYTSYVFKTFGKTEEELREVLKDYIKNRNKIVFVFNYRDMECDIYIRYSNKTAKNAVSEIIAAVTIAIADCTYSLNNKSLSQVVADLLMVRGKKIKIAESFTGGGVASSLINYAGISNCLKEGIVCYSNESKVARLKVDTKIIANYGAVSIETAYEMAANLLMDGDCDLSLATTGNAGPTSEKPDQQGLCFIAVGDIKGINLYNYYFVGDRQYVISCGIKAALFRLYQLLAQDEFKALLSEKCEKL